MSTIEDAIEHCHDVIKTCNNKECAIDHIQLANWLNELVQYKKKYGDLNNGND